MLTIEQLTAAQRARFPEFVERWTQIGVCTDPADRPRAELAIREVYRCGGLPPPHRVVWCASPWASVLASVQASVGDSVRARVRARVWDSAQASVQASVRVSVRLSVWAGVGDSVQASVQASVRDSVWASVRLSVWAGVGDSVQARVWDSVGDSVRARVWDSVQARVWDSVRARVWDSVRARVWDSARARVWDSVRARVWDSVGGSHEAAWLSVYAYFREVCGLTKETDNLLGLFALAQTCGWILPYANICWASERHNILSRDDRGRLHNLNGPACAYPDGWSIYAVHGVLVPADVIERPAGLTIDRILKENNAEVRRVMIERVGNARFIAMAGAVPIYEDRRGKLYRIELPGDESLVVVQVVNSTPEPDGHCRSYLLRVPPTVRTAQEAVAWTFGLATDQYAPNQES